MKRIQRERQYCPGDLEAVDAESIEQNSNKTKKIHVYMSLSHTHLINYNVHVLYMIMTMYL